MFDLSSVFASLTFVQAVSVFMFISGVIIGEYLTYRFFGKPKSAAILADLIIFVIVASLLFSYMEFREVGVFYYAANLFIGILTVVIVRSIEYPLGLTEKGIEHEKIIINIIRTLSRHGLDKQEIKEVLRKSGFSSQIIKRYDKLVDEHVPKFLTRMVKLEHLVEEMKDTLDRIENNMTPKEEGFGRGAGLSASEVKRSVRKKTVRKRAKKRTSKKTRKSKYVHPIRRIAIERNLIHTKPRKVYKRKGKKKRKVTARKKKAIRKKKSRNIGRKKRKFKRR